MNGSPDAARAVVEQVIKAWTADQERLPALRERAAGLATEARTAHQALTIIAALEALLDPKTEYEIRHVLDEIR